MASSDLASDQHLYASARALGQISGYDAAVQRQAQQLPPFEALGSAIGRLEEVTKRTSVLCERLVGPRLRAASGDTAEAKSPSALLPSLNTRADYITRLANEMSADLDAIERLLP